MVASYEDQPNQKHRVPLKFTVRRQKSIKILSFEGPQTLPVATTRQSEEYRGTSLIRRHMCSSRTRTAPGGPMLLGLVYRRTLRRCVSCPWVIDSGLVGSTDFLWEEFRESKRCSRDTYPESYHRVYFDIRRSIEMRKDTLSASGWPACFKSSQRNTFPYAPTPSSARGTYRPFSHLRQRE